MPCFICSLNSLKNVFHYIYANVTCLAHNLPNASICQGYFQSLRGEKSAFVYFDYLRQFCFHYVCVLPEQHDLSGWRKQERSWCSCAHLQKCWLFNQCTESDVGRNTLAHVYSPWCFRTEENYICCCLHLNYTLDCNLGELLNILNHKNWNTPLRCLSCDLILFLNFT